MIVTVTPKGGKPIKKKFATVEEAIAFINSFNSQPPNKACSGRVARVRPVKSKVVGATRH